METILAYVRAIVAERDPGRANDMAAAALGHGLRHSAFHSARARWLQLNDRNSEALGELQLAIALAPHDAEILQSIGISLLRLGRPANAIAAFDAAIRIAPADAQAHYLKGCACSAAGEPTAALRSHERAIALRPDHADALAAAAAAAARAGDSAKARRFAERTLRVVPAHPTAIIALAMCDIHDSEFVQAEKHLGALLSAFPARDETRALALGLLGDAFDGQDRTDTAFEAYTEENEILRDLYKLRFDGEARLAGRVEQLIVGLQEEVASPPEPAISDSSPAKRHVFLLGFMRSGTTLLEQVLAAHSDVETLEERETLAGLCPGYMGRSDGSPNLYLPHGKELDLARETYWRRVRAFGAKPDDKIFVEKQPFNTLFLPLIARLFPSAKIIFQVRDPRDVILSCFRRHLEVKPTTFELLTLADAARFYDRVMRCGELCRSKLPLDIFEVRYEDIVSEFDNSVLAICRHLGMEWTDSMRDFDRSARSRAIRSVSSSQVRQRLYPDGIGYWHRYEKQLAPVLPSLRPWVERFGYPAD
ncbi:MAG TPA: sulfotransferase [Rhizomicrobium sp.]|nr:sulfotransferase [Rhizomicrobium sp.]